MIQLLLLCTNISAVLYTFAFCSAGSQTLARLPFARFQDFLLDLELTVGGILHSIHSEFQNCNHIFLIYYMFSLFPLSETFLITWKLYHPCQENHLSLQCIFKDRKVWIIVPSFFNLLVKSSIVWIVFEHSWLCEMLNLYHPSFVLCKINATIYIENMPLQL